MLKRLICWFQGHRWRRTSEFTGGVGYRCDRCDEAYVSLCGCPSWRPRDDHKFHASGVIVS